MGLKYGLKEFTIGDELLEIEYEYSFHERDEIRSLYLDAFQKIKDTYHYYILIDLTCIEDSSDRHHTIVYHFLNPEKDLRLKVKISLQKKDKMISFVKIWPSASALENVAHKQFGVSFFRGRGHQDLEFAKNPYMVKSHDTPCLKGESSVRNYPKYLMPIRPSPFESRLEWTSIDPSHFPLEGLGRLNLLRDKKTDTVKQARLYHQFNERFLEKRLEQSHYFQIPLLLMRSSTQNSKYYSLLFSEIIEELADIDVPDRAKSIRMIILELGRISSHFSYLEKYISICGFSFERELVRELHIETLKLISKYHKRSSTFSPFLVGGVFSDISTDFINDYIALNDNAETVLIQIKNYLYGNRSFMKIGHGVKTSPLQSIGFAATGPTLRASGVKYDLRTSQNNYFYSDLDFEVPLGIDGTCYDRFIVHLEEVLQSFNIINQMINFIPGGKLVNNDHHYFHLCETSDVPNLPEGEVYRTLEGPEGEMGIFYSSLGDKYPHRFHLRTPSRFNLELFHKLTDTLPVKETMLLLQSFNIDSWELGL